MPGQLRLMVRLNPVSHTILSVLELFLGGIPAGGVMLVVGTMQFWRSGV